MPWQPRPNEPETPEWGVNSLLRATNTVIAWMHENGYEHDASRDRPAFGRGGAAGKPESPPPSDVLVPTHCGEAMRYKQTATGKGVYECRKGKDCSNPREYQGNKYGAQTWEEDWRKMQEMLPA
mgnify:CR=1 FL=1